MGLSLEEQLRKAIEQSGRTCYAIAKESSIDKATLSRFMNGQAGLSRPNISALLDALGLEVKLVPKRTK
jgi:hypothetical protein